MALSEAARGGEARELSALLERAAAGGRLSQDEGLRLLEEADLLALGEAAEGGEALGLIHPALQGLLQGAVQVEVHHLRGAAVAGGRGVPPARRVRDVGLGAHPAAVRGAV